MEHEDHTGDAGATAMPSLEQMQQWTAVIGRAQQAMLESMGTLALPETALPLPDPARLAQAQADFWQDSIALWQRMLAPDADPATPLAQEANKDRRFSAPQWRANPMFDLIRQSYLLACGHLLRNVDALDGLEPRQREQLRFVANAAADAMSPANFPFTNPLVLEKAMETDGASLLKGFEHMMADFTRGQLTQSDRHAFEVGRNIAITPGKVVKETPLYQLIQYTPATETVLETPLLIFPPWINRYYILDLNPQKSFIRWAVAQGLTVFVVSWKSADESLAYLTMDDYVLGGELDAIDTVRALLGVEAVHTIGYCVAGTHLAALLAYLAATGEAGKVASATFFAAQVDFSEAGDLTLFVDDRQLELAKSLAADKGYLDGRYMAATFNLLRGRDLIWSYVVNNYLLGEDYPPFDLLHWNGDTTNLPAKWHAAYLQDLYRDNKLARPGAIRLGGVPIDLSTVKTPSYVQAGIEDHIAPAKSVWKITEHFTGPLRFVLAGSGHIAGVVNPPAAGKYHYWTGPAKAGTLDAFLAAAKQTKGSWWPDWMAWITKRKPARLAVDGARIPGQGSLPAIEDAPGKYARAR